MKKNIFLTLALALTFAGTAWGQTTEYFEVTSVTFNANYPFVYDGTEKTYITGFVDNCSLNDGSLTGNTATNAGSYTATISSQCYGHPTTSGEDYYEEFHVGSVTYNWSIQPRDISKTTGYNDNLYVAITVKDQKWTGSPIYLTSGDDGIYTIKFKDNNLTAADFDVYITKENSTGPVTILDEGRYTIVFTGKGNFTGTVTKTFDVKKELADPAEDNGDVIGTGIYFYIPTQILIDGKFTGLKMEAKDQKSHATLYEGNDENSEEGDYLLVYFEKKADAEAYATAYNDLMKTESTDPEFSGKETAYNSARNKRITNVTETINKESRYWFVAVGIAPKYQGTAIHEFYTANEYQTYQGSNVDGRADVNLRIVEPGYPVAETSPTGEIIKGKMEVSPKVIKTLTIGSGSDAVTLNVSGCTNWQQVIDKNPNVLVYDDVNQIISKKGSTTILSVTGGGEVHPNDEINTTSGYYCWQTIM